MFSTTQPCARLGAAPPSASSPQFARYQLRVMHHSKRSFGIQDIQNHPWMLGSDWQEDYEAEANRDEINPKVSISSRFIAHTNKKHQPAWMSEFADVPIADTNKAIRDEQLDDSRVAPHILQLQHNQQQFNDLSREEMERAMQQHLAAPPVADSQQDLFKK
jgi:hypothetical protein